MLEEVDRLTHLVERSAHAVSCGRWTDGAYPSRPLNLTALAADVARSSRAYSQKRSVRSIEDRRATRRGRTGGSRPPSAGALSTCSTTRSNTAPPAAQSRFTSGQGPDRFGGGQGHRSWHPASAQRADFRQVLSRRSGTFARPRRRRSRAFHCPMGGGDQWWPARIRGGPPLGQHVPHHAAARCFSVTARSDMTRSEGSFLCGQPSSS